MSTNENNTTKRHLIGVNVSEDEKAKIEAFARDIERRPVAAMVRIVLDDYMNGRLVRVPRHTEIASPTFQSVR